MGSAMCWGLSSGSCIGLGWVQVLSSGRWEAWRVLSSKWLDVVCVPWGGPVAASWRVYGWGQQKWDGGFSHGPQRNGGGPAGTRGEVEGWVEEVEGVDCGSRECGGAGERGVGGAGGPWLSRCVMGTGMGNLDNNPAGQDLGESEMQGRCPCWQIR